MIVNIMYDLLVSGVGNGGAEEGINPSDIDNPRGEKTYFYPYYIKIKECIQL